MYNQDDLSNLQKQADELVKELTELHDATNSYKTASKELEKIVTSINPLVDRTKELISESQKIIIRLSEINSKTISDSLSMIEKSNKKQWMLTIIGFATVIIVQFVIYILNK